MKPFIAIFILAMLTTPAFAQAKVIAGLGANINYQLANNGRTYETKQPFSFRLGYRFKFADIFSEYSYVKSSSGVDYVSVGAVNHEFLIWIRKVDPTARIVKPFIALGAGAHYEVVTTRLAQEESREPGAFEFMAAATAGVQLEIAHDFEMSFEGRATAAPSYAPNPMLGLGAFLNIAI